MRPICLLYRLQIWLCTDQRAHTGTLWCLAKRQISMQVSFTTPHTKRKVHPEPLHGKTHWKTNPNLVFHRLCRLDTPRCMAVLIGNTTSHMKRCENIMRRFWSLWQSLAAPFWLAIIKWHLLSFSCQINLALGSERENPSFGSGTPLMVQQWCLKLLSLRLRVRRNRLFCVRPN